MCDVSWIEGTDPVNALGVELSNYSLAIRRWLPYILVGAAISLVTALVFHISLAKTVVAILFLSFLDHHTLLCKITFICNNDLL
ncbi:MAG: hypothetical protein WCC17_07160 [Candidatus Nitrosopolaris sp.]